MSQHIEKRVLIALATSKGSGVQAHERILARTFAVRRHIVATLRDHQAKNAYPVSILYKSIAGRYRPVRVADGPITVRYRFIKNASWVSVASGKERISVAQIGDCACAFEEP